MMEVTYEPDPLLADGRSYATMQIKVTNPDGSPRPGDELSLVRTKGHGQLKVNRVKTDSNGIATVDYYSYRGGQFTPIMINEIMVTDLSVGKIIGIKKSARFEIALKEPDGTEQTEPEQDSKNPGSHLQLGGG